MFRYIITDTFDGSLKGTNDHRLAEDLSDSEDFFVYDTATNQWITVDGRVAVEEYVRT